MLRFEARKRLGDFALDARFSGPEHGVTMLFGASGCGKSTILALIGGALAPDEGRITLGERVLEDTANGVHVSPEARRIGWVFQDARLFPHLSVAGNLDYGARRTRSHTTKGGAYGTERSARIERTHVIEVLDLGRLLERRPRDLSGGERQRVAIGRALLAQPQLLLMDEPLASLDRPRQLEILSFIERTRREFPVPIVYVTHSLGEAARLADRLVLLDRGRVVAEGSVREIMARGDLPLLAAREDAGALLEGEIVRHEPDRGLAFVRCGAGTLAISSTEDPPGSRVRLHVLARDVILATEHPARVSVRNVLECRVAALHAPRADDVLVTLDWTGGRLLAAVTPQAAQDLALAEGMAVFALIKSVAITAPASARALHYES